MSLERAAKLLATIDKLRLKNILCDVLLQSQKVEREMLEENPAGDVASEATTGTADSVTESIEASGVALDETFSQLSIDATIAVTKKIANDIPGVLAHRVILAAASPGLHKILLKTFKERQKRVVIPDVEQDSLQAIVEYIYSPRSLTLTVENASELAKAAKILDVAGIREATHEFMTQVLKVENALHVHAFAERHNYVTLADAAERLIEDNGKLILQGDQILTLPADTLAAFLDRDRLDASEKDVLETVLRWTEHRRQERKEHLDMLLKKVRFELVPRNFLSERVNVEPLSSADPSTLVNIIKVLNENESVDRRTKAAARIIYRQAGEASSQQPPTASAQRKALFVAGGKVGNACTKTVLVCSLPEGRWETVESLEEPRSSAGVVLLGGLIYVIGGDDGVSAQSTVYKYDTAKNSWATGHPMKTARNWLGAAELDGRLYAVGGWDPKTKTTLKSAEAMDPRDGVWTNIAPMLTSRRALGVATLHDKLYAVGGHDGKITLNSTERYDPVADKWELMELMAERRAGLGVGVVDNEMYAVGGLTRSKEGATRGYIVHQSVEKYTTGWETAQSMPEARRGAAVTANDGQLYVIGGFNSRDDNDLISKVLVLEEGTWSELSEMPEGRAGAAAVILQT